MLNGPAELELNLKGAFTHGSLRYDLERLTQFADPVACGLMGRYQAPAA